MPIRKYDQIYMKTGDLLYHLDLFAHLVAGKRVAFVGDGDAVGLALCYLASLDLVPSTAHCTVLDFDERTINSVQRFAENHGLCGMIDAKLYNVMLPLPDSLTASFECFYTNPPYSSFNKGLSAIAFIGRGMELCSPGGLGYLTLPFDEHLSWTEAVLLSIEEFLVRCGWILIEGIQQLHTYHLDDNPRLMSGLLVAKQAECKEPPCAGRKLPLEELPHFYNRSDERVPLYIRAVADGYYEDYGWEQPR